MVLKAIRSSGSGPAAFRGADEERELVSGYQQSNSKRWWCVLLLLQQCHPHLIGMGQSPWWVKSCRTCSSVDWASSQAMTTTPSAAHVHVTTSDEKSKERHLHVSLTLTPYYTSVLRPYRGSAFKMRCHYPVTFWPIRDLVVRNVGCAPHRAPHRAPHCIPSTDPQAQKNTDNWKTGKNCIR